MRLVAEHRRAANALGCEAARLSGRATASPRSSASATAASTPCIDAVLARLHERTPAWARASPSTGPTFPPTPTGSGSCPRTAASGPPIFRPRRLVGAPLRRLDAQGRRVLRLQGPRGRGHGHRPSARVDASRPPRTPRRLRARPARRGARRAASTSRHAIMDKGYDNGPLHDGCMERGVCPITPLEDTGRQARRPPSRRLRARRVDVRRDRLQAAGNQVALPDRRVHSRSPCGSRPTGCTR